MNTSPFAAIGAIGIVMPGDFTSISWSQSVCPSFASSASTCASDVPRNRRPRDTRIRGARASGDGVSTRPLDHPFLLAGRRVDCVRSRLGREVQRARDHDRSRLQRGYFRQRVAAHRLQLRDVARGRSARAAKSGRPKACGCRRASPRAASCPLAAGPPLLTPPAQSAPCSRRPRGPHPGRSRRRPTLRSALMPPRRFAVACSPPSIEACVSLRSS